MINPYIPLEIGVLPHDRQVGQVPRPHPGTASSMYPSDYSRVAHAEDGKSRAGGESHPSGMICVLVMMIINDDNDDNDDHDDGNNNENSCNNNSNKNKNEGSVVSSGMFSQM